MLVIGGGGAATERILGGEGLQINSGKPDGLQSW